MSDALHRLRDRVNARFPRLRIVLAIVAPLAALWAITVAQTDGFELTAYGIRLFSTRGTRNPTIIAAVGGIAAWLLASADERLRVERRIAGGLARPRVAHSTAILLAAATVAVAVARGGFVAGGSDAYGYVSEAHLFARGQLRVEVPLMLEADWPGYQREVFQPLGYKLSVDRNALVPTYSIGYPMLMAAAERLAGPGAVFYVVPLLGGLTILATYALGTGFAGPIIGLSAAVLMATSPSFLFQLMVPMSDVPVTAWSALTLALLQPRRRWMTAAAGLAAGCAILTRPNLAPMIVPPTVFLIIAALFERRRGGTSLRQGAVDVLLFVLGPIAASLIVAYFNNALYGSPLLSGYGPADALFGWRFVRTNIYQYSSWLTMTQTPVMWLFVLAPFAVSRRTAASPIGARAGARAMMWLWLGFCAVNVALYLPYLAFKYEEWFYLRFLLPSFPVALVLLVVVLFAGIVRMVPTFPTAALLALVWALAARNFNFSVDRGGLRFDRGERKFVAVGEYARAHLPENTVFFALLHSGSARYYSGRLTVRFDLMPDAAALDNAVAYFEQHGYRPYLLLEPTDEAEFVGRFAGKSRLGDLDWPPIVTLQEPDASPVKIWDPRQAP